MRRIEVNGGRITLPPFPPRWPQPIVYNFGDHLLSCTQLDDGFIIELNVVSWPGVFTRKLSYEGGQVIWELITPTRSELLVSEDDRTLTTKAGFHARFDAPLLFARSLSSGIAVLLRPTDAIGARNLFYYDLQGNCKWRVGPWPRFQHFFIQDANQVDDGNLRAVLQHGGQALIVDSATGSVLQQIDWKA
ncbi:MAG TPA: hypothetical protein VFO29_06060 [Candidatus Rubrimentiphilum sp.]|nr:hypothetical protein [Candidatus Rubrimentiphilum sp.]